jgi:hypothetical protein
MHTIPGSDPISLVHRNKPNTLSKGSTAMTIFSKARKTAIATVAAVGVIAAGAAVAPTQAHAGGKTLAGALIGGVILGGLIGAASQNRYAPVVRTCHTQWETRYNSYGQPYSVKVQYC